MPAGECEGETRTLLPGPQRRARVSRSGGDVCSLGAARGPGPGQELLSPWRPAQGLSGEWAEKHGVGDPGKGRGPRPCVRRP